jgi:hypothetical protein
LSCADSREQSQIQFEGLRFRAEAETSPTHSDTLSALIPQNIPSDTGYGGVSTGLVRGSESLPYGDYSDVRGLSAPNFSEKTESETESKTESKIDSKTEINPASIDPSCELQIEQQQNIEIEQQQNIEIVLPTPLHPIFLPEPLPAQDSYSPTNPVQTPPQPVTSR